MKSVMHAADVLLRGGVIAYPTEGVFGLGCLPDDFAAVQRVVAIKQRDASKGLILMAVLFGVLAWSSIQQLQRPRAAISSGEDAPLP